ncbi:MAG TPA: DUF6165 family protein [Steroidobacteraceae bacterium]|jgi:hypothetical protein|nr:DUF6165 family protein [Steroidobacteraceae bacterium]
MSDILVPVSPGELLDKITILRLKCERIGDASKLANTRRELALLEQTWQDAAGGDGQLAQEEAELARVNGELWEIEDHIREHEAQRCFDAAFVQLARSVYLRNDERAAIKRRINLKLNSAIIEEKSYRPYAAP